MSYHNIRIKLSLIPEDKRSTVISFFYKLKQEHKCNVTFSANGRINKDYSNIYQINANIGPKVTANLRLHTNALAIVSI